MHSDACLSSNGNRKLYSTICWGFDWFLADARWQPVRYGWCDVCKYRCPFLARSPGNYPSNTCSIYIYIFIYIQCLSGYLGMSRNQWLTKGLPNSSMSLWNPWILLDVPCLIVETNPFGYSKVSNISHIYLDVGDSWNVLTSTTKNFCHALQWPHLVNLELATWAEPSDVFSQWRMEEYIHKLWK